MFKWLKKQKYKIAIALCSILSIFTLFLGFNKTYAYETDTFSYTIDTSNITLNTIDNKEGFICNNQEHVFDLLESSNNNYYLLINFYILNSDNSINTNITSLSNFNLLLLDSNNITLFNKYNFTILNNNNDNMYTGVWKGFKTGTTNSIKLYLYSNSITNLFITNIDFVEQQDIALSQYYETYYGQIEDNYNTLLDNYNTLQDNYNTLQNNYNTLENNYNTLESNYNDLNTNYENYYNSMYMGNFANLKNINWYNNNYDITITQEELLNNEYYYFDFAEWDIYNYFMNYEWNENNLPTGTIEIDFNFNNTNLNLLNIQLSNTNQYLTTYQVFLKDSSNTIKIINLPLEDNYTITLTYLQSLVNYSLDNHYFYMLKIYNYLYESDIPNDQKTNIKATITYDSYYYQYGYNNGVNSQQGKIEEKNNKIATLEHEKEVLNEVLATSNARYWDLVERYNNLANDPNSLYGMVISVADVPLHVFQQIFNFDILGINISALVMSIISLLVIIWLIKKLI